MRAALIGFALLLGACTQATEEATPTETPVVETTEVDPAQAALAQMPPANGARAAGVDFRGVGQEPGWIVDIYQRDHIRLLLDYGETLIDFPLRRQPIRSKAQRITPRRPTATRSASPFAAFPART